MVSKRDKDAESGLQVLTAISIIWAIGFFYWSRNSTILGYDAGRLTYLCCSGTLLILPVIFVAAWMYTRKENKVKKYLDGHFISSDSVSVDEISLKFGMKRVTSIRTLRTWIVSSKIEGDYDETTGVFRKK